MRSSSRGKVTAVWGGASSPFFFVRLRLRVSFLGGLAPVVLSPASMMSSSLAALAGDVRIAIGGSGRVAAGGWISSMVVPLICSCAGEMVDVSRADSIQDPKTKWSASTFPLLVHCAGDDSPLVLL